MVLAKPQNSVLFKPNYTIIVYVISRVLKSTPIVTIGEGMGKKLMISE
jgi:hypothetical protein